MHIPEKELRTRHIDPETLKRPRKAQDISGKTASAKKKLPVSMAAAALAMAAVVAVPVGIGAKNTVSTIRGEVMSASGERVNEVLMKASLMDDPDEAAAYIAENLDQNDLANVVYGVVAPSTVEVPEDTSTMSIEEMKESQPSEQDILLDSGEKGSSSASSSKAKTEKEIDAEFSKITADSFDGLSQDEKIELLGKMAREDDKRTGIPASLTMAQALLESGWMDSGLTRDYENYYGIKASSDGYNWEGSTWKGEIAEMSTGEYYGYYTTVYAGFRVYSNAWESMRDHSAYLLHNTRNNGAERRYPGIEECEHVDDAAWIVADGGYATSPTYAESLIEMADKYDLRRFDYTKEDAEKDKKASGKGTSKDSSKTSDSKTSSGSTTTSSAGSDKSSKA